MYIGKEKVWERNWRTQMISELQICVDIWKIHVDVEALNGSITYRSWRISSKPFLSRIWYKLCSHIQSITNRSWRITKVSEEAEGAPISTYASHNVALLRLFFEIWQKKLVCFSRTKGSSVNGSCNLFWCTLPDYKYLLTLKINFRHFFAQFPNPGPSVIINHWKSVKHETII